MADPPRIIRASESKPFTAPDGSRVREIVQVGDGARNQSLAEAVLPPGAETTEHLHRTSEEIYVFASGSARIRVDAIEADVEAGEAALIPPGTPHKLTNTGAEPLVFLCCCAPPYSDEDTELLE